MRVECIIVLLLVHSNSKFPLIITNILSTSSGLHLTHKVSWHDLSSRFTSYSDPGIELPIGVCGQIHAHSRKTQIQLANRAYLSDQVCSNQMNCEDNGTKVFRKSDKHKFTLERSSLRRSRNDNSIEYNRFIDSLASAIREFAQTERNKVIQRKVMNDDGQKEVIDKLRQKWKMDPTWRESWSNCLCEDFTSLIEAGDSATLLSFSDEQIRSVLNCHPTQAIGKNISFLWYHVLSVYVYTNMIVACNLQDNPEKWGPMAPDTYFRSSLQYDCDGQTFLHSSRSYLTPELYMKDWNAMKQLCKNCFQFLYFVEMLRQEVMGDDWTVDSLKNEIYWI